MDEYEGTESMPETPAEETADFPAEPIAEDTTHVTAEPVSAPETPVEPSAPETQAIPTAAEAPAPPIAAPTPGPAAAPVPAPAAHRGVSVGGAIGIAVAASLVVGLLAGGTAGVIGAWLAGGGSETASSTDTIKVLPSETDEPVVAAAAAASPSVVNIDVSGEDVSAGEGGLPGEHPTVPQAGSGSGVAYQATDDGGTYILTNSHVVENAKTIVVTDASRTRHTATLVGADPETDIAVVKIVKELPLIEVGDSDELQVGQLVVAIGSPFGLTQSVSSGVVSAVGRSLPDSLNQDNSSYPLVDVIQTDAAINPGNSGGALVDRTGRLVGINSAIYSESGANDGIGFAIPVNNATRFADQLIKGGTAEHPFLGVVGRDIDPQLVEEEGLPVQEGAFVIELTEGGNAEKAGIKPGDVVVSLDGEKILGMDDLLLQVRRRAIGDEVTIGLYRDGKLIDVKMTVGVKPENLESPSLETTEAP